MYHELQKKKLKKKRIVCRNQHCTYSFDLLSSTYFIVFFSISFALILVFVFGCTFETYYSKKNFLTSQFEMVSIWGIDWSGKRKRGNNFDRKKLIVECNRLSSFCCCWQCFFFVLLHLYFDCVYMYFSFAVVFFFCYLWSIPQMCVFRCSTVNLVSLLLSRYFDVISSSLFSCVWFFCNFVVVIVIFGSLRFFFWIFGRKSLLVVILVSEPAKLSKTIIIICVVVVVVAST